MKRRRKKDRFLVTKNYLNEHIPKNKAEKEIIKICKKLISMGFQVFIYKKPYCSFVTAKKNNIKIEFKFGGLSLYSLSQLPLSKCEKLYKHISFLFSHP